MKQLTIKSMLILLVLLCIVQVGHTQRILPKVSRGLVKAIPSKIQADIINLISPRLDKGQASPRPVFRWSSNNFDKLTPHVTYEVKIVELELSDSTMEKFDERKTIAVIKNITSDSVIYPSDLPELNMGKIYGWQVTQFRNRRLFRVSEAVPFYIVNYKFPFDIRESLVCANSILSNGTLEEGSRDGVLGEKGSVFDWQKGYGNPIVVSKSDGCSSPGYVRLYGNKKSGSCIFQALKGSKIKQGKHYRFSICMRLPKKANCANYAYLKVIAFNGTLPVTGMHPSISSDIANVGWSGKILQKDWITLSLNVWTPNKDFDNIAVYCLSASDDIMACCEIDKICLQETNDAKSCDDYSYSESGQPVIDPSLTTAQVNKVITHFTENNGLVSDLYSSQGNTSLDTWYPSNDPCSSIGGTIPDTINNIKIDDYLVKWGIAGGKEELEKLLSEQFKSTAEKVKLSPILPIISKCKDSSFTPDNSLPFSGRDIIFVHGLQLGHLCEKADGVPGAQKNWPADANEFYSGGYYKKFAEGVWADHIKTWLRSRGYNNRVLVVAYNCSQPAIVAAHAILTQIRDAMYNGRDVQIVDGDKRGRECFGRNAVAVSHSTGGFVFDAAMALAEQSKTDPVLQSQFGNAGFIPDNIKAHVALQPSLAGSNLASVYLAIQAGKSLALKLNGEVCKKFTERSNEMYDITHGSILIDLQPGVTRSKWSGFINSTPVPTITIAGGHPYGVDGLGYANWALHPGLDDGVLTMSSQIGCPNVETGAKPSGYYYPPLQAYRVYDMGITYPRANSYFANQTLFTGSHYAGASGVAYLSATGMLQPVGTIDPYLNPANRYKNHYSFLQSASDHYIGPRGKSSITEGFNPLNFPATSGFTPPCYDYAKCFNQINNEESRCITDPAIYTKGLVSPQMQTMQYERTEGDYLDFDVYGPQFSIKCCPLKFKVWWGPMFHVHVIIWERRYHNMVGYECESECSYMYKYVLRN